MNELETQTGFIPGHRGMYTTRHYIYGHLLRISLEEYAYAKKGGPPKRTPKKTGPKYSHPTEDRDGQLGQIQEEAASKENTQKMASQRASQAEIAPDQVNVAINEADDFADQQEEESQQYDTAFHNDKRNLK